VEKQARWIYKRIRDQEEKDYLFDLNLIRKITYQAIWKSAKGIREYQIDKVVQVNGREGGLEGDQQGEVKDYVFAQREHQKVGLYCSF
jgi:isopentenyldiphosphate isomerase